MGHIDRATMTLIALGEDVGDGRREHVQSCPACTEAMARVRKRLLWMDAAGAPATDLPPPSVWEAIHRQLELGEDLRPDPLGTPGGAHAEVGAMSPHEPARTSHPARPGRSRRMSGRRRSVVGALTAAAAAALLWTAVAEAPGPSPEAGNARGDTAAPRTMATAGLTAMGSYADAGSARVDLMSDGGRMLVVHSAATASRGHREVWLLAPDASTMVSLGAMEGVDGAFRVPDDVDLSSLPVVDISSEPDDGDPAHSGDSILRGRLDAG
ncbi:anti-sigma factor domain-containing protein [Arthrobacter sp. CP30]